MMKDMSYTRLEHVASCTTQARKQRSHQLSYNRSALVKVAVYCSGNTADWKQENKVILNLFFLYVAL